jgi:hypothetical protein
VHPDVTLRLETPVLYVHSPAGFHGPLDVRVAFHGGWLTEYYPDAEALAPGIDRNSGIVGRLSSGAVGELHWSGLTLDGTAAGPHTTEPVWLAPRAVAADAIGAPNGESERFLFYRGVGHIDPLLHFLRDPATGDLSVPSNAGLRPQRIWLADIRPDGTAAFRTIDLTNQTARIPGQFAEADYSAGRGAELRAGLKSALIGQGLYKDEAEALLNTWALSYFKSPGMRAFFMVPRSWTDQVLPLTVTPAAAITRVMVGRIELVTPAQRAALEKFEMTPVTSRHAAELYEGLGRFREALVLADGGPGAARLMKSLQVRYAQP